MTTTTDALGEVELQSAVLIRHFEMLRRRTDTYREVERAEYLLLRTLASHGPVEICPLADLLGVDPSTAGRQVTGLVAHGLVTRETVPGDRRRAVVALTPAGRRAMRAVQRRRRRATETLLDEWDPAEVTELARLLGRYNATVAEHYLT